MLLSFAKNIPSPFRLQISRKHSTLPAVFWVAFSLQVKVQGNFGINTNTKVIVHHAFLIVRIPTEHKEHTKVHWIFWSMQFYFRWNFSIFGWNFTFAFTRRKIHTILKLVWSPQTRKRNTMKRIKMCLLTSQFLLASEERQQRTRRRRSPAELCWWNCHRLNCPPRHSCNLKEIVN